MKFTKRNANTTGTMIILLVLSVFVFYNVMGATPEGATLEYVSNSTKVPGAAGWDNSTKGAIHTINLDVEQQDLKWKAYVGNVSASFTLDDENGYSIYQWGDTGATVFTGNVYMSRKQTAVTWSSIECANETNKTWEDNLMGHDSTQSDSINRTFSAISHKQMEVGDVTLTASTCYATATWINDTVNAVSPTAAFQELLLWDGSNVVYATFIENDKHGYMDDDTSTNTTYDFQAIVAENATTGSPNTRYYFYVELTDWS